jgi:hypothetical protein
MSPEGWRHRNFHRVSRAEVYADSHIQDPWWLGGRYHRVNPLPIARKAGTLLFSEAAVNQHDAVDPACQVEHAQLLPAGNVGEAPAVGRPAHEFRLDVGDQHDRLPAGRENIDAPVPDEGDCVAWDCRLDGWDATRLPYRAGW